MRSLFSGLLVASALSGAIASATAQTPAVPEQEAREIAVASALG